MSRLTANGKVWAVAVSRGGKQLALARGSQASDVVTIANFK